MLGFASVGGLPVVGICPLPVSDLVPPPSQPSQDTLVTDLNRLTIKSLGSFKVPRLFPARRKEAQGKGVATICGPPGQFFGPYPVSTVVAQLGEVRQCPCITTICSQGDQCFGALSITSLQPHSDERKYLGEITGTHSLVDQGPGLGRLSSGLPQHRQ